MVTEPADPEITPANTSLLPEATLSVRVPAALATAPDPEREAIVRLDPPRFSVAPLLTATEAVLVRRFALARKRLPLLTETLDAPAFALRVALPATVMDPAPRFAATVPPSKA